VEKTHRAPPSRTQRAPTGVNTRIARSRITLASLLRRIHTLTLAIIATHAALLPPCFTRLLRQRLSGIRSLHDYDFAPASIRLCWCDGIRSHYDTHDHAIAASIRLCRDYDYGHDHEYEPSASIRLC
jgi:hypothetical protein